MVSQRVIFQSTRYTSFPAFRAALAAGTAGTAACLEELVKQQLVEKCSSNSLSNTSGTAALQ